MEMESAEAPMRKVCSFEIETCFKAQSRETKDFATANVFWDDDRSTSPPNRWNPLRRFHSDTATVVERRKEVQRQFESDLAEARLEDTQDLEILDFIRLGLHDRKGHETLVFIAKHIPNDIIQLERTQRFIMQKLESVGQRPYSVLYIHTGSNLWNSQLGLRITWNLFRRIPRVYRERLDKIYVLHPDMYLQIAYVSRLDDLQPLFPTVVPQMPSFVKEHDSELDMHPLMDYGFCTVSEADSSSTLSGPSFYT